MSAIFQYIIDRLKEPSSWRGIVGLLTSVGVVTNPDLGNSIIATGIALMGLIGILTKDKTPPVEPDSVVKK